MNQRRYVTDTIHVSLADDRAAHRKILLRHWQELRCVISGLFRELFRELFYRPRARSFNMDKEVFPGDPRYAMAEPSFKETDFHGTIKWMNAYAPPIQACTKEQTENALNRWWAKPEA